MSATIYILGIILQAVAGIVALMQLRFAPRRLPWLLIAISSLLIVARRSATLGQFMRTNRELAGAEILTLVISLLFFLGVLLMSRMFRQTREAEKAVLTAYAYNRSLIEASLDPLVTIGPDGRITDVNTATEKVTGRSRQDLIGTNVVDYFTDPERARAGYVKVFEEGRVQDYLLELRHRDGSVVPVLCNATVYKDDEGRVAGVFASARDITELKRVEEAVQRERDLLQAVMNAPRNVHLAYLDMEFNFVRVNETYAATCGYSPEDMIGKNHFALYPHPENEAIFARVRETGEPFEVRDKPFEFPDQPERGVTYWDWTLTLDKDDAGQARGLVFALVETTERRRTEDALKASLREKEVLLKEIHHRVKNNLMVVASIINLQSSNLEDSTARDMLQECRKRIQVMSLIHNKLYRSADLSRINFSDYADDLLTDLVRSHEGYRDGIAIVKNVGDFFFDIDTTIPLGLILNELFSNAMKYAFPGERQGTITVNLERRGGLYELSVMDDGVGFPEDIDFTRTESLGMQLVVTLAEQLEGSVELIRDQGTTFRLTFGLGQ